MTSFSDLLPIRSASNELMTTIPETWMQGRATYGGLSSALCYHGAIQTYDDLPPLRSAQISFIGPVGGDVTVRADLLRRGKSVAYVQSDVVGQKGLATRGLFAFGAGRESVFDEDRRPLPSDLPGPDDLDEMIPKGLGPAFVQHFDARLAGGGRPFSGSAEREHFIWARHRDPSAAGVTALIALADMPPPAITPAMTQLAMVSSMTWQMNITTDNPQTDDGWWLIRTEVEHLSDGYESQDMTVWNRAGEVVMLHRQSVAVFA